MKTFRMLSLIILCVFAVIACAFLPQLTSWLVDENIGAVQYMNMESISLNIREMEFLEKLGCFTDNSTVFLPDYLAKTHREDIPAVIAREFTLYQDAGIISYEIDFADSDKWYMECELAMCYNTYAPEKTTQFWLISMSSAFYMETSVQIVLDDSTGAVLLLEFETQQPVYSSNIPYSVLQRFYTVYFNRLGVPLEELTAVELEPVELSKTSMYIEFGWVDATYGKMILNFQVYEKGFFVALN